MKLTTEGLKMLLARIDHGEAVILEIDPPRRLGDLQKWKTDPFTLQSLVTELLEFRKTADINWDKWNYTELKEEVEQLRESDQRKTEALRKLIEAHQTVFKANVYAAFSANDIRFINAWAEARAALGEGEK